MGILAGACSGCEDAGVKGFAITERDAGPGYREIDVKGELDLAVADQLQRALDGVGSDYEGAVVGLENCEFIDSTGLAVILRAHQRFAEEGRRLVVCGPSKQVHRILTVTGLTGNGLVFDGVEDALGHG